MVVDGICPKHGPTSHRKYKSGSVGCTKYGSDRISLCRRRLKQRLVREHGGKCVICGYDKCYQALQFHHREPGLKLFGTSGGGSTRSYERAAAEAAQCVLLCSRCHVEVEVGVTALPPPSED